MNVIIPNENETYQEYINRILNSRENKLDKENYQERHHIIPKCINGTDSVDNLIYLYAQEHYYTHKLLALENPDIKGLQQAWWNMCQCTQNGERIYNIDADDYANARIAFSNSMKNNLYAKGLIHTEETKIKMSNSHKGLVEGDKNPMYGKHCSEHCKSLLSKKLSGGLNPAAKKVKCIETGEIFECVLYAAGWCGLKSGSSISSQIQNKQSYAGKHPITREQLHWEYVE